MGAAARSAVRRLVGMGTGSSGMAKADINNALAYATAMLAASDNYGEPADGLYEPELIVEGLHLGDEQTVLAIMSTDGHFSRGDFLTLSADIVHGGAIPEHVGELGDVMIKRTAGDSVYLVGNPASHDQINRWRANTGVSPFDVYGPLAHDAAGSCLAGYFYSAEEAFLYYTGTSAKVFKCSYQRASSLQSPAIYLPAVVAVGLGSLPMKDGADPAIAQWFGQIRGETKALPDLSAFKKAA